MLEGTLEVYPELTAVFHAVIGGETFASQDFPQPLTEQRLPPIEEQLGPEQHNMDSAA